MDKSCKAVGTCTRCDKSLVAVGSARVGGKNHADWREREMHKKCWLEHKKDQDRRDAFDEFQEKQKVRLTDDIG